MLIPDKWVDCFQVSPKNLRLSAIIISIYEIVSRKIFSLPRSIIYIDYLTWILLFVRKISDDCSCHHVCDAVGPDKCWKSSKIAHGRHRGSEGDGRLLLLSSSQQSRWYTRHCSSQLGHKARFEYRIQADCWDWHCHSVFACLPGTFRWCYQESS